MFPDRNIHYDVADKVRGWTLRRPGRLLLLVKRLGLADALDADLHLLKRHLPYHESDHVLNLTYNILVGGTCLQDLELLRNDETLPRRPRRPTHPRPHHRRRFPPPLRRQRHRHPDATSSTTNACSVWQQQPEAFFEHAIIEADGTLVGTDGRVQARHGPVLQRHLGLPPLAGLPGQHAGALVPGQPPGQPPQPRGRRRLPRSTPPTCAAAPASARSAFRGDTDFSQTEHLDRWDGKGIRFVFGIDAMPNLVSPAQAPGRDRPGRGCTGLPGTK